MAYDDATYKVIKRQWFGLTKKWGGDVAAGYSPTATNGATVISHLAKWYPKGPIKMVKAGSMVLASYTNASGDLHPARIKTRGASASVACTWNIKSTATAIAQAVIASTVTFTVSQVKAGEYINIETATVTSDNATTIAATTTGTVAFFVDYIPTYDGDFKHEV